VIVNLESRYYADSNIFEAERLRIFRTSWQLVCSADSIAEAASYRAAELAGSGILLIRGTDGELRAFRNVCRHRGSRLLEEGAGRCSVIACPYHGWQYDDRGRLIGTPWFDEATPFDLKSLGLSPLAIEIWRGLVFVALAPEASLLEQLGDLPQALADVPLESFTETHSEQLTAPLNWKGYVDQFVEYYHTPSVHAPDKSIGIAHYTAEPARGMMLMLAPEGSAFYGGRWLWAWPNWTLSVFSGGMKTSRIEPLAVDRIAVYFHYYFADTSAETRAARQRVIDATRHIFAEDVAACARAQRNYASGDYQPGPLHPRHERALAYFQGRVRAALNET
jgi:choline monooxygenase